MNDEWLAFLSAQPSAFRRSAFGAAAHRAARRRGAAGSRRARRARAWTCPSRRRRSRPSAVPSGTRQSRFLRLCRLAPSIASAGTRRSPGAARVQRVPERLREEAAGDRGGMRHQVGGGACRDDLAAAAARAGAQVHDVLGAAYRLLVVLDHEQRVALGLQAAPAWRAGCGCRADAGRWWARRGCSTRRAGWSPAAPRAVCAAPRRRRAWARRGRARGSESPTSRRKARRLRELGDDVPGDIRLSSLEADIAEEFLDGRYGHPGQIGDGMTPEPHRQRGRIQSIPVARSAGNRLAFVPVVPPDLLAALLLVEAGQPEPGAVAARCTSRGGSCRRRAAGRARESSCRTRGRRASPRTPSRDMRGDEPGRASPSRARALPAARGRGPRPCRGRARDGAPRAARASFSGAARTSATGSSMVCSLEAREPRPLAASG